MTEPQVWVLIGMFSALMFGMMTIVSVSFVRVLRSEISGLRGEINARFEAVEIRFQAMERRFDDLDRDVQAIARRVFPEQS